MPMTPVRQAYELQLLDSKRMQLERTLAGLDDGSRLRALTEQVRAEEEAAAAVLKAKQARLRSLELELQGTVDKARKLEGDMYSGRVSNPKELTVMGEEVQVLGRQRRRIEDEMLTLMEETEQGAKDVAMLEAQRQARERELEDHLVQYQTHTRTLNEQIAVVRAERDTKGAEIDPDLLRRYERLRDRKEGLAVAMVVRGICEGCHVAIPEGRVAEILEGVRIFTCEECGRILYVEGA